MARFGEILRNIQAEDRKFVSYKKTRVLEMLLNVPWPRILFLKGYLSSHPFFQPSLISLFP